MLINYLTIALRNLVRYKTYSLISIAGLAVGMTCCILILRVLAWIYVNGCCEKGSPSR